MSLERPDPDALLRRVATDAQKRRGRLKVFFGASPGVGKTYAMLESARARARDGTDASWAGSRRTAAPRRRPCSTACRSCRPGRRNTAASGCASSTSTRRWRAARNCCCWTSWRTATLPGSRHAKRWQDAQELLDAGIDVYTTLNVQHVESLNDSVNQVTGVTVRETVPDRVLDEADEVEVVDLPPEELLQRLEEGKVYVPEQAARATRQFFRRGNLLALRELVLRRTADHVDADVQDYRRDHASIPPGRWWSVCWSASGPTRRAPAWSAPAGAWPPAAVAS